MNLPTQAPCSYCGTLKLEVSTCPLCMGPSTLPPEVLAVKLKEYKEWEKAGFPGEETLIGYVPRRS